MTWLVTADLHLTDRPQDAYRWGIFDWLAEQQEIHKTKGCLILGDITDKKDCHSASLVNRLVDGLCALNPPVYILKGNHDYVDRSNPFFKFLSNIDGIDFICETCTINSAIYAIPHQPDQASFDAACKAMPPGQQIVLLHGLFDGAIAETGQRLTGLSLAQLEKKRPRLILAGDVHKPQQVGCLTYVGAPYRVRFGDDYNPRVVLVRTDLRLDVLVFPCPTKHSLTITSVDDLKRAGLKRGDQVKLTIALTREEVVQWEEYKKSALKACEALGVEVFGPTLKLPDAKPQSQNQVVRSLSPVQTFEGFCLSEDIRSDVKKAGLALLE